MTTISTSNLLPGNANQATQTSDAQNKGAIKQQDKQNAYAPPYVVAISQLGQALISEGGVSTNLTDKQQQALQTIYEKYKDAPATEATVAQIKNDLKTAGIAPDKILADESASASANTQKASAGGDNVPPPDKSSEGDNVPPPDEATSSSSSDAATRAKRKIAAQVGQTGADTVVDSKGNIDQRRLKELLEKQEAQSHRFDITPKE
jgi:hypothetical protein